MGKKMMKTQFKLNIEIFTIILFMMLLLPNFAHSEGCGGSSCSNSTCEIQKVGGVLPERCPSGKRYDVDPNCVMNQNAKPGSCIDTMPVTSMARVSETNCYRANGAGGNPTPRNHLGTDYAAVAGTVVTAAADGVVVHAKGMSGGGRTIIIEHEKVCQCTAGNGGGACDTKYVTVYMHLLQFLVSEGTTVTKGQPIGQVGGSNFKDGILCDYPNKSGGCSPYGPHLHFEIHSGGWDKGYSNSGLKASVINPLCDDIQQFCGGCSYDVQKCQNKAGAQEWEELSPEASLIKQQAAATGMATAPIDMGEQIMAMVGCSLESFLSEHTSCWFCPMFKVLFNTASILAEKAYKALAVSVISVVLVAFAIWVSVVILRHIAAVEVKDPRKMLQEIMLQAFKVFMVVAILKISFYQVMHLTLEPVFNTGMAFVQAISDGPCDSGASYLEGVRGYDEAGYSPEASNGGLPRTIGINILCSIKSMQDSLMRLFGYGWQAWCIAWGPKSWLFGMLPDFGFMFTGIVLMIGGLVLIIAFPWCLVDCVIQMAIASALAPAALGAWAFKVTGRYLKIVWDFFMNAMFNFVFLSIILYIIMTCVDLFMNKLKENVANGWEFLEDPINGLAYWGVNCLKLVVICLMGWVFLDEGKTFADKFAKGANLGIGKGVGGSMAQGAKKAGGLAGKAGKAIGKAGMGLANKTIGKKLRDKHNQYRINKVKNGADNVIKDDNGNIIGYERTRRNILGQKVTRRVDVGEDGKEVWSKEKPAIGSGLKANIQNKMNNTRRNLMFGGLKDAQDIYDENGNLVAREGKNGKEYYDKDGNVVKREHYHRNLIGRRVTTTDELGEDGQWHMSRTKENLRMELLSKMTASNPDSAIHKFAEENRIIKRRNFDPTQAAKMVSSDKNLSVVTRRDANGNIVQKELEFRSENEHDLFAKDGSINMQNIEALIAETSYDEKTIMEAVAVAALKNRGVAINSQFSSRDVAYDKATKSMTIVQRNRDGSSTQVRMSFGGPDNNQMLTEVTNIDRAGNFVVRKDNGLQNCTIRSNSNGIATVSYGISERQRKLHPFSEIINKDGKFAGGVDEGRMMYGFDERDLRRHGAQVRTGKAQIWSPSNANQQVRRERSAEEMLYRDARTPQQQQVPNNPFDPNSKPVHPDGRTATMSDPIRETIHHENGGSTVTDRYVDDNGWQNQSRNVRDAKGRIIESNWQNDQGSSYSSKIEYDDANRTSVEKEVWVNKDGQTTSATTYKEYRENGKILSERIVNGNSTTERKYGEDGKIISEVNYEVHDNSTPHNQEREHIPTKPVEEHDEREPKTEKRELTPEEKRQKELYNKTTDFDTYTDERGQLHTVTKNSEGQILYHMVEKEGQEKPEYLEMRELNHKGIVTYERVIDKDDNVTLINRDDDGRVTFMEQTTASGEVLNRTIYNDERIVTSEVSTEFKTLEDGSTIKTKSTTGRYDNGDIKYKSTSNDRGEETVKRYDEHGKETYSLEDDGKGNRTEISNGFNGMFYEKRQKEDGSSYSKEVYDLGETIEKTTNADGSSSSVHVFSTGLSMEERKTVNGETTIIHKDEKGSVTSIIEETISAEGELITTTKDAEGNVIITNRRPYKKNK